MAGGSLWRALSEPYAALKALAREKETLFWVIVFPLIWLALMVAIFGSPSPPEMDVGVAGEGPLAGILAEALNSTGFIHVKTGDLNGLLADLNSTGLDAVLYVESGEPWESLEPATVVVYYKPSEYGNYTATVLESVLDYISRNISLTMVNESAKYIMQAPMPPETKEYAVRYLRLIAEPMRVEEEPLAAERVFTKGGVRALYAFNMVGIEALFVGLFAGVNAVNERRRTGSLRLILSTPTSSWELLAADTLATLLLIAVSSAVILAAAAAMGADYSIVTPAAAAAAALLIGAGILFTLGLGFLIAPLARNPETSGAIVNAIAFPVMFAGGLAVPKFFLPEPLRAFAGAWPLTAAIDAARRLASEGLPPAQALQQAWWAAAAAVLVYALGGLVYRRLLERAAEY